MSEGIVGIRRGVSAADRKDIFNAISASQWLGTWPCEVRQLLAQSAWIKRYPNDTEVHPAGTPVRELWMVVEGALELRRDAYTGARSVLSFSQPGEILGFNSQFSDAVPTYNVMTYGFTKLIHIPGSVIREVLREQPELVWTLASYFFTRLQLRTDYIALHATAPLKERIILQLLQMARQTANMTDEIYLRLSQESLAFLLGTSRQSINRELKTLKDLGLIDYKGGKIHVPSLSTLMSLHDLSMKN
ncbi:Crp/Fnr family transcriptional regulator [Sphingomonas sp. YL-JM2C]